MKSVKLNLAAAIVLLIDAVAIIIAEVWLGSDALRRLLTGLALAPLLALIVFWWKPLWPVPQLAGEPGRLKPVEDEPWWRLLILSTLLLAFGGALLFWVFKFFNL